MVVTLVHRLFGFDGRVGRIGYLLFTGLYLVLAALPALLGIFSAGQDGYMPILTGFALAAMIAGWSCAALTVQRLHDLDCSGLHTVWIAALALAAVWLDDRHPIVSLALIILLGLIALGLVFAPGETDQNRFGAPPR